VLRLQSSCLAGQTQEKEWTLQVARIAPLLVLLVTLLVAGCSGTNAVTETTAISGDTASFETPDEAITCYLEGVAEGDVDKILSACAINEATAGFRFDLSVEHLGMARPLQDLAPSEDPFFVQISQAQLSSQICTQVKMLAYDLLALSDEEMDSFAMGLHMSASEVDGFVDDLDSDRLADIEVEQIAAVPGLDESRTQQLFSRNAAVLGADELTERVVLFSFEGDSYYIGFRLLRYDENWKVYEQRSMLLGTEPYGAQGTTVEAFESMSETGTTPTTSNIKDGVVTIDAPDDIAALLTEGAGDDFAYYAFEDLAPQNWQDVSNGTLWICCEDDSERPPLIPEGVSRMLNSGGFTPGSLITLTWSDQEGAPDSSELDINELYTTYGVTYEGAIEQALEDIREGGIPSLLLTNIIGGLDGDDDMVRVVFE
jgi:hypothetical protein